MMPILARFRGRYEEVTLPLGRLCLQLGLTPNALTTLSLLLGILAGYILARGAYWQTIGVILLVGLADVADGAAARAGGMASPYGMVLDHTVDRYVEFMVLLGAAWSGAVDPRWALFTLFGMVMASYVRARAESTGLVGSANVGLAGRQEKLALLLIGLLLQPLLPGARPLEWAVIAAGAISHLTAWQRLRFTRRTIVGR
ncbi:MAG: CDP-alcohol phosphatidyltransferase family protein [Chloroflexi bacterium OHK40]